MPCLFKKISVFFYFCAMLIWAFPTHLYAQSAAYEEISRRNLRDSYRIEEVEPSILKMTHKQTGLVKYVDIGERNFDFGNPPPAVQVIDLINVDTTLYNQKYIRQQEILLVGGAIGYPMVISDFNNNGLMDFAGEYKIPINTELAEAAIIELQTDSTFLIKKVYKDTVIIPLSVTDVDSDGLLELNITDALLNLPGLAIANYEQSHPDSFPNIRQFTHRTWEFGGEVSSETFTELDNDIYMDMLYVGTDSTVQCCHQIFVAEYDTSTHDFQRRFSMIPSPDWRVSGFSVGDFDDDSFQEFATGSVSGKVYLVENTGDNSYQQVFYDTLSTPNAYITGATNDIDGNGKLEFFVGGSAYYNGIPASRIYWFEPGTVNNYYKVRSFFLLGTNVLGFSELYIHDVNSDGVDDLIFSFSYQVVILVWNRTSAEFDLFYFDKWENFYQEINSISMYDLFNDGYPALFVSVKDVMKPPRVKSLIYKYSHVTGIDRPPVNLPKNIYLQQNYPNPFNSNTVISFKLSKRDYISLTIYDIAGKEVKRLIKNQVFAPGEHEIIWNSLNNIGKEVSSGIYIYELKTGDFREVKKMLLIR